MIRIGYSFDNRFNRQHPKTFGINIQLHLKIGKVVEVFHRLKQIAPLGLAIFLIAFFERFS